jgi:hypothetical protein
VEFARQWRVGEDFLPLDQKFDLILKQLPNLRLVSVSPWTDREIAAAKFGDRYVYAWKANPALLCGPRVDWKANARLIRDTQSA